MSAWSDIVAAGFVLVGLFFFFVGAIGVVRLPDTYHRLHAATKAQTLGLVGLLVGVMFHIGTGAVDAKVITVIVFLFTAGPVGSHMLAKAALRVGDRQWKGTLSDEHAEDGLS
ncbi:MAG: monovalent cation/H(+) antiporter subunit G [Planctomycetota bacterium]